MNEPIRKKVGGSLSRLPPWRRVEMLRHHAQMLQGGEWKAPQRRWNPREPSFEKWLVLLAESQLRFVPVGGLAVTLHGYVRLTEDVAILLEDSEANVSRRER